MKEHHAFLKRTEGLEVRDEPLVRGEGAQTVLRGEGSARLRRDRDDANLWRRRWGLYPSIRTTKSERLSVCLCWLVSARKSPAVCLC